MSKAADEAFDKWANANRAFGPGLYRETWLAGWEARGKHDLEAVEAVRCETLEDVARRFEHQEFGNGQRAANTLAAAIRALI